MRIVLINPAMNVKAGFGDFASLMEPMPCIGIAGLASSLRKAGHEVRCIDNFALNLPHAELIRRIDAFAAEVVGQSCLTPTAFEVFRFNALLAKERPKIRTVLGNVHAAVFAGEIIEKGQADFVLEGECEYSLPMLLNTMHDESALAIVPGLYSRSSGNGHARFTRPAERIEDLDALPTPDWSDLPWRKYTFLPFVTIATPVAAIMGSRGCPYHCTFCSLGYQGRYRVRSPEGIVEEMAGLVRDMGARHIGFVDPIYPLKKDHLSALCGLIRQRRFPRHVTWTSETRVDALDKEMMREMKSANVRRVLLGIESGVDRMLEAVNKRFEVEQVKKCIRWTKEVGLETSCFFILGLPGETREETRKTVSFPIELDVDFAKFAVLIPLPGSKLYHDLVEQGRLSTDDWTKFTTFNPSPEDLPYVPEGMTGKELLAMQWEANLRFYFRPRIILRHLFRIRTISYQRLLAGFFLWLRWKLRRQVEYAK